MRQVTDTEVTEVSFKPIDNKSHKFKESQKHANRVSRKEDGQEHVLRDSNF